MKALIMKKKGFLKILLKVEKVLKRRKRLKELPFIYHLI
jgi:hypothetical protein